MIAISRKILFQSHFRMFQVGFQQVLMGARTVEDALTCPGALGFPAVSLGWAAAVSRAPWEGESKSQHVEKPTGPLRPTVDHIFVVGKSNIATLSYASLQPNPKPPISDPKMKKSSGFQSVSTSGIQITRGGPAVHRLIQIPSGIQTWLPGKSPINRDFNLGEIIHKGIFQQANSVMFYPVVRENSIPQHFSGSPYSSGAPFTALRQSNHRTIAGGFSRA